MFKRIISQQQKSVFARQFSTQWMQSKLAALHKTDKTIGIVVHQDEVKSGELDGSIIPEGLSQSKEFRQDLNMGNSYWFYHKYGNESMKRILLLQKSKDKKDAKDSDIRKSYRSLGATACASLQAKKVTDVEFLVSSKVADKELLGIFENSFYLANYENNLKRPY